MAGKLNGRQGSFTFSHRATMMKGDAPTAQELSLMVVPNSGTGELTRLTGSLSIHIDAQGKHTKSNFNAPPLGRFLKIGNVPALSPLTKLTQFVSRRYLTSYASVYTPTARCSMPKLKTLFLSSAVLFVLSYSSIVTAATCSKSTLNGRYGALLSGVSGGIVADSGGLVIADGKGNLSGTWSANANGNIQTDVPFTGKYTVNATCAGTADLIFSSGTAHFNIIVHSASRFDWIETDSGTIQSGYALAVGTSACSDGLIKGNWSWLQTGADLIGVGPGAFIGLTKFNGTGDWTGSVVTESINGEIETGITVKGTYVVNSDCSGTITGAKDSPANVIIVVNDGQEILTIGMSTTVVSVQTLSPVLN
jgi:hypothetical protein